MNVSYIMLLMLVILQNNAHSVYSLSSLFKQDDAPHECMAQLGHHIIAEFLFCEQNLDAFDQLEFVLRDAAQQAHATVIEVATHQFWPQGMSGIVLLAESHISLHTWPEYGYAAIDVYTCGKHVNTYAVIQTLQEFFKPKKVRQIGIDRGYDTSGQEESDAIA